MEHRSILFRWGDCEKCLLKMKFCIFFLMITLIQANATLDSQNKRVSIKLEEQSLVSVFRQIKAQSGYNFVYNNEDVQAIPKLNVSFSNEDVGEVLNQVLKGTELAYRIDDDLIIIYHDDKKNIVQEKVTIRGVIRDQSKEPLIGVNIIVKELNIGTVSGIDGSYELTGDLEEGYTLLYSFIGMVSQSISYSGQVTIDVIMEAETTGLGEVVVNGIFEQSKNSFTGSVKTIKKEELLQVSNTNVMQALNILTPGMTIVENADMGSNPNHIPDIILRGTTTLVTGDELGLNTPLIIMDGVEITLKDLYDIDIFDIDRVDVLKDASATVLYGEKGANGVIVVTRTKVEQKDVRVKYNLVPLYQIPNLSSFDLLDAREKLEFERRAELYSSSQQDDYYHKLNLVNSGVDIDWVAKPLRFSWGANHSLNVSGRASNMDYQITARYGDNRGIMKGDFRNNLGIGFYFKYNKNKYTTTFRMDRTQTKTKDSPYGSFNEYVSMNPYNPVYDKDGEFITIFPFYPLSNPNPDPNSQFYVRNPLYEAEKTSSFSKSKEATTRLSATLRYDIFKGFYVEGQGSITATDYQKDVFLSPLSASQQLIAQKDLRGRYTLDTRSSNNASGRITVSYGHNFDADGTALTLSGGSNISGSTNDAMQVQAQGFRRDYLNDIGFANSYYGNRPVAGSTVATDVGFFSNSNFIYKNRYYADFSYRVSASSKFGDNKRWAPFYSFGLGWNLHKERFLEASVFDRLRLKASYGYVGSSTFPPQMAVTIYEYKNDLYYPTGDGTNPINMGNPNLKWQSVLNGNYSIEGSVLNNKYGFDISYWTQKTTDMVLVVQTPPSVGVTETRINYGEMFNSGFDFELSTQLINNEELFWSITATGGHTFNRMDKLSNTLDKISDINQGDTKPLKPAPEYREGGSVYDIYAVRTAGIDPATGREVYITKDGDYTFVYNTEDKVVVGNSNPFVQGSLVTFLRYKNFSISLATRYTLGGDIYNGTLAGKVEGANPYENADARVMSERWMEPGDVTVYKGINKGYVGNRHTDKYVQRNNELVFSNLSVFYDFNAETLKKTGLKRLRLGVGISDFARISTAKYERGGIYPYARNFNITISPTF